MDFYITSKLGKLFDGTEYEEMTGKIQKLMEKKTPKVIYLNCLHFFDRDIGDMRKGETTT